MKISRLIVLFVVVAIKSINAETNQIWQVYLKNNGTLAAEIWINESYQGQIKGGGYKLARNLKNETEPGWYATENAKIKIIQIGENQNYLTELVVRSVTWDPHAYQTATVWFGENSSGPPPTEKDSYNLSVMSPVAVPSISFEKLINWENAAQTIKRDFDREIKESVSDILPLMQKATTDDSKIRTALEELAFISVKKSGLSIEEAQAAAAGFGSEYELKKNDNVFMWLRKKAESGDAPTQYLLGYIYKEILKDDAEGFIWIRKSAEQGFGKACCLLAEKYSYVDWPEALKWYVKGAEKGDREAQFKTGQLYMDGLGVKEDRSEAIKWFQKAADQGHLHAKQNLKALIDK